MVSDTLIDVQTPEGIGFVLHPAGLDARLCAYLIDAVLRGILFAGLAAVMGLLGRVAGSWIYMLAAFALSWFYHVAFELLANGQSPGKRILGLRVVRSDGAPVDPGASFLRNLLRFADSFMSLSLIAFVSMAASPGFRRLGDWAADTLVVYTLEAQGARLAALRDPGGTGAAAKPVPRLAYEEKQALLSFARRVPLLGRERAEELAAPYAAVLRRRMAAADPASTEFAPGAAAGTDGAEGRTPAADWLLGIAAGIGGTGGAGGGSGS